jgi:hypothetical protein
MTVDGKIVDAVIEALADTTGGTVAVSPGRTYTILETPEVCALISAGYEGPAAAAEPSGPAPLTSEDYALLLDVTDALLTLDTARLLGGEDTALESSALKSVREKIRARL